MKRAHFLLILSLVLISCNVANEDNNYSGIYSAKSITVDKIRVYTSEGEITNYGTIQNYLNSARNKVQIFYPNENVVLFPQIEDSDEKYSIRLEFLKNNQARFLNTTLGTMFDVKKQNNILYLEDTDTMFTFVEEYPFFESEMFVYKPFFSDTIILGGISFSRYAVRQKYCVYFKMQGNKLLYPICNYFYNKGVSSWRRVSNYPNIYNENFYKHLIKNKDIIAVQQMYVVLENDNR